jgi:hypothetical protein
MTERGMATGGSDRRGFLRGAATAAAAVGAGVLFSGSAYAEPGRPQAGKAPSDPSPISVPPPVGVEIPCSAYAANAPLKLNIMNIVTLDFKGGINYLVKESSADGIVLEVQGFRMEADLSPTTPDRGTIIVLALAENTRQPVSVVQSNGEMFIRLPLTVATIDKATGEETVLAYTDPSMYATLRSTDETGSPAPVKTFPPVNQNYMLQEPVHFYPQGGSKANGDAPIGELPAFDVLMNQSA